jgi:hypothetical protein
VSPISPATAVLLRFLDGLPADQILTSDSWRDAADAAQLNVAERGAAPRAAARLGYLEPLVVEHAGRRFLACEPSNRASGKGGRVLAYVRTPLAVPEHICKDVDPSVMPETSIENEHRTGVAS